MDKNKSEMVAEAINEVSNQRIDALSERLEALQKQNKNAGMWHKLNKGFKALKNSSVGVLALGTIGTMAVLAYGPTVNNPVFTTELGPQLATAISVAYGGMAGFIATHLGHKKSEYNDRVKSSDVESTRKQLMDDVQYMSNHLATHEAKYGVNQETRNKMDQLYKETFDDKNKSPQLKESDDYHEKKARKIGMART